MDIKNKILIAVVLAALAFAVGRYTAPEHIRIETRTVEVSKEAKQEAVNKDEKKSVVVTETIKPDGTKITQTKTVDVDKDVIRKSDVISDTKTSDTVKDVTSQSGKLNISAMGATNVNSLTSPLVWGAHVSRNIVGPVTVGVFGLTNGQFGCSIGISF